MTRDEYRAKCIETMAKTLWRLHCKNSEEEYHREGRAIPEKWADPWNESGCGLYQQRKYMSDATFILDALHGLVFVVPREATEEMVFAGDRAARNESLNGICEIFRAMVAAGDLTNPPREAP